MTRFAARLGIVEIAGNGLANTTILGVTNWTFSASRDKIDVTGMSDSQQVSVLGLAQYDGTIDRIWDDTQQTLMQAADYSGTTGLSYTIGLYAIGQSSTTHGWVGPAFLDYDVSGDVKDTVKEKYTFSAASGTAWVRT